MKAESYTIKVARFDLGLTQAQLAEKAHLALRTVQKAESGKSIAPSTNRAIRDALGLK